MNLTQLGQDYERALKERDEARTNLSTATRIAEAQTLTIANLQRDVNTYAKRDELIVGRMMMERDRAREEANTLRTQLASENQRCAKLDATCGELQEELNRALRKNGEMSIELTAPRCPKCGSLKVEVLRDNFMEQPHCYCRSCCENGTIESTIDAALDAWRPTVKDGLTVPVVKECLNTEPIVCQGCGALDGQHHTGCVALEEKKGTV